MLEKCLCSGILACFLELILLDDFIYFVYKDNIKDLNGVFHFISCMSSDNASLRS